MMIVSKLLRALQGDIKVSIVAILISEDMASFRLLSRRLRVNNKRLKDSLRPLISHGIIEEVQMKVSDGRTYRAYRLKDDVREVLRDLLE